MTSSTITHQLNRELPNDDHAATARNDRLGDVIIEVIELEAVMPPQVEEDHSETPADANPQNASPGPDPQCISPSPLVHTAADKISIPS